ncbi:malonyl-ACP O-methyltransferase BioC [Avibacterium sp. 20-15]|uniref:malonyl-ACP O-methyltransferase BioC n=1 Tax=unclassified Avibacterium TaxID=2685287 RepID=UPI0020269A64|nr:MULTISPECIES: malonyl-ACP O-methyltransferase BioC [unclassified Avibacterium]MCW9732552.1 malonyl-ACP O-methyltransferase BioC [Avibacterium sp. 20-15]URL04706.1 malonyl-ACP O-methyltransferase BioC [Avibacterium sp. 20-132]
MNVVDKSRVAQCFSQALPSYDSQAKAQQQINQQLLQLLLQTGRTAFSQVLEIGCGTGHFSQLLAQHLQVKSWAFNDLCDVKNQLDTLFPQDNFVFYQGDGEIYPFPTDYDLIASASAVQWFADPQAFVNKCADLLREKGILLISTFAPKNLAEIRALTGIGLDYPDLSQWQQWLSARFEIKALFEQAIPLYFASPLAVLQHLKVTGVTATGQGGWTKGRLQQFIADYNAQYQNTQGQVRLNYQPLFILAEKLT